MYFFSTKSVLVFGSQRRDDDEKNNNNNNDDRTITMTEPAFAKASVLLTHRKLRADVGSFILLVNLPSTAAIARIIDTSESNLVLILKYYSVGQKNRKEVSCKGSEPEWIDTNRIDDIVFVLLDDERKKEKHTWFGRKDTFVSVDDDDNDKHTFPCDSPLFKLEQSIARQIWEETQDIRMTFRHLLGSASLNQGDDNTRKEKVSVSIDTFKYLERQVVDTEGVTICGGKRSKIVYEVKEGLQAFSNKRACVSKSIKFENTRGVHALTELIGTFAIFGIRQRRPKLADPLRKLETYDGVHYLVEEEDRVSASLEYAKGLRQLTVMVTYQHYLVRWLNGVPQNVPTTLLKDAIMYHRNGNISSTGADDPHGNMTQGNATTDDNKCLLGASFEYHGELKKVTNVCDGNTFCECTSNTSGEIHNLQRVLVETLVMDYLN